jgi:hypothetical protein
MATEAQRTHMHHLMDFLYGHRGHILYPPHDVRGPADVRTFRMTEQELEHVLNGGGYVTADCSEMVTEVCRMCGLRDPNGLGYRYAGYTGTMLQHLPHYSDPALAGVGALVVFGPGTGEHVSMVYTPGEDPLLQSHGRPGMDRWRLSEERRWHSAPVTFLSIAGL